TLDALFISGRRLSPSHSCTELCHDIFHSDLQDRERWPDLEPITSRMYRRYGERYEQSHPGQFVAVVVNGEVVTAHTLRDVVIEAIETCPNEVYIRAGFYIFRIGQRSVGVTARDRVGGTK